ncbi:MAG TPA: invasion associated locus B family protein [Stellaceae bacterium]|jgi:invasion protein IalB|nr:invasion associated locus B family protein [Stellaceae bacterium]
MAADNSNRRRGGRSLRRHAAVLVLIAASVISLAGVAAERKTKEKPPVAAETSPPVSPAAAPAPGAPSEPEKLGGNSPAWTVACFSSARSAPVDCKVEQRLFAKDTGRILSIAVIDVPGSGGQPTLQMHLPVGLSLQDAAALSIDGGDATQLAWQSCDANGCYATLALTPALVAAMKKGKIMSLKVVAANRRPLVFEHLLTDFATAYGAAQ